MSEWSVRSGQIGQAGKPTERALASSSRARAHSKRPCHACRSPLQARVCKGRITYLSNLTGSNIGAECARALVAALNTNRMLQPLTLDSNINADVKNLVEETVLASTSSFGSFFLFLKKEKKRLRVNQLVLMNFVGCLSGKARRALGRRSRPPARSRRPRRDAGVRRRAAGLCAARPTISTFNYS